ncbi:MAG: prepilin-type N-terminal cleavage/methylation domain-containing protein [Acidobacteria bacterium]|nr:prepilin-type N-terminal cleavage/methylation domain-containing protein [Acidobacteriota bacterium]
MSRKKTQSGLSLLEVLVATFIMAVAITGLVSNMSGSLRNASKLGEYDRAAILARRQMDELQLNRYLPRWTQLEGYWDANTTGSIPVRWRATVTPYDYPPNPPPKSAILDRIEWQIQWPGRNFTIEGFRRGYLTEADAIRLQQGQGQ